MVGQGIQWNKIIYNFFSTQLENLRLYTYEYKLATMIHCDIIVYIFAHEHKNKPIEDVAVSTS